MKMVVVNDGQMEWVADQAELRKALESLGWSEDGSRWTEPEGYDPYDPSDISEHPYTILCQEVTDLSDDVPSENRYNLPRFRWRPDWKCWHLT